MHNLKPGKDLIVIKRFDAILGEQICDISVDGKKVGQWKVDRGGPQAPLAQPLLPRAGHVRHQRQPEMSARRRSRAERDINMFQLWFYQPA